MFTAFVTHSACLNHLSGAGHPECPQRLRRIHDRLEAARLLDFLHHVDAPCATDVELERIHTVRHVREVFRQVPESGTVHLDRDTLADAASPEAARRAAGAVIEATRRVLAGEVRNAFCSVRPPGHHAMRDAAMGFCFFNNVAAGAAHALEEGGLQRIAIVDFDAHLGNGTEDIFQHDERVLYCSLYQRHLFPSHEDYAGSGRAVSIELPRGAGSGFFRNEVNDIWKPALESFQPEMIFLSTGFDAHAADPMSDLTLTDDDFRWISEWSVAMANRFCGGRLVSTLEGGYELESLGRCAALHVQSLLEI